MPGPRPAGSETASRSRSCRTAALGGAGPPGPDCSSRWSVRLLTRSTTARTAGRRSTQAFYRRRSRGRRPARRDGPPRRRRDRPGRRARAAVRPGPHLAVEGAAAVPHRRPTEAAAPSSSEVGLNSRRSRAAHRRCAQPGLDRRSAATSPRSSPASSGWWTSPAAPPVRGAARRPDRTPVRQISRWRTHFDSELRGGVPPLAGGRAGTPGPGRVVAPPSAFAAGIIASRELRLGLPWGPANELAARCRALGDPVTDAAHDRAARSRSTCSGPSGTASGCSGADPVATDPDYRQLSVRRLMTMLGLTLERESASGSCSSRTPADCGRCWLRRWRHGARGTATARRVRRGHRGGVVLRPLRRPTQPARSQALGQLIAEVGVAPAAPLEYIVVRIARTPTGTEVSEVAETVELLQTFRFAVTFTGRRGALPS